MESPNNPMSPRSVSPPKVPDPPTNPGRSSTSSQLAPSSNAKPPSPYHRWPLRSALQLLDPRLHLSNDFWDALAPGGPWARFIAFLEEAYKDPSHRHIAIVLFPCGHGGDRITQLQGLNRGKPKCLSVRYWK
ncbi:hypothetical protein DFP72DRAFT_1070570 [Ephemerocybe angulata]|uniref:Uncharacterized protein n=1 Tax=Ephemerocybe angulata TaxID=980116 RepID=A0A8H6M2P0_9AGAR|nr:hypothetical protein DFP72DRAFT_1070570 [Tulosesus angulatus]